MENILVLAPHTDDEIHCAGTLAKYKERGAKIDIISFAYPKELPEIRVEFENSCKLLKAKNTIYDLKIRNLNNSRQEILDTLIEYSKNNYDLVFCPCTTDTHQDHEVIRNECFRAFKTTNIWGYFAPHNCRDFNIQIYSIITESNLLTKMKMIDCYKTQNDRMYFGNDYFKCLAKTNGIAVKQEYAEVFENIRSVIK